MGIQIIISYINWQPVDKIFIDISKILSAQK